MTLLYSIDYDLVPSEDGKATAVGIKTGKYAGVLYHYGHAQIIEEEEVARLKFDYTLIQEGKFTVEELQNDPEFREILGDILTERVYTPIGSTIISGSLAGNLAVDKEQINHARLYQSIKGGGDFEMRRTENISTQHFFVRATNREFNYSNNPTYVKTDGTFVETTFKTDPYTYITTIGLLNDANELIAVAKTSQPIPKSFDKEVLIKVKLSF